MSDLRNYLEIMTNVRKMSSGELGGFHYSCNEDLILREGRSYSYQPLPEKYPHGVIKQCFKNAHDLVMIYPELTYVEGFASNNFPTMHAWCVDADGNVVDNTWLKGALLGDEVIREYLGIPFPREYVFEVTEAQGTYGVLDNWKQGYPLLKHKLDLQKLPNSGNLDRN